MHEDLPYFHEYYMQRIGTTNQRNTSLTMRSHLYIIRVLEKECVLKHSVKPNAAATTTKILIEKQKNFK